MQMNAINRRQMLQATAAGTALGCCGFAGERALAGEQAAAIRITEPFHGAVLNHRHGKQAADGLTIRVSGQAPANRRVTINGAPCRRQGSRFDGEVTLRQHENNVTAVAEEDGNSTKHTVRVVWDRYSEPRYRFSIDDNSFFLRDIAQKNYKSLFDCWYLKMLRDLHTKYGVKFTVNIYYAAANGQELPGPDSFRLPQFSDRYKGEWRDNANWLRLAFHAYSNMPNRPYQDAPPEKLMADLDLVANEIRRFAGEEAYALPTVIHWGMTRQTALKPLFDRGVRALSGYFARLRGKWDVNYNFDDVTSEYLSRHNAWKDFQSGIVFSRASIVCNGVPLSQIAGRLEPLAKDPNTAEIMDLFTHEQYFWPFYSHYLPDHPQRIEAAIRWATEHGYKPVFLHEGFLGGRA